MESNNFVSFAIDDDVTVNSVSGYIDFIGEDCLVLIDAKGKKNRFSYKEIKSFVVCSRAIVNNMSAAMLDIAKGVLI